MKIVSLIIGRGNNSLKDKNILPVLGRPLLQWGGLAAINSKHITHHYISSDDEKILEAGREVGFNIIKRPDYLALPNAQSSDVVKHALDYIESETGRVDIMVVVHANVGTISTKMIDECIDLMQSNKYSAVIPSHYKYEYHPRRAKRVLADGTLDNYVDNKGKYVSANRQELDPCVFFDHSFWVLHVERGIRGEEGQYPWPVMGNKIYPYITEGCFDVHDLEDLKKTEQWLIKNAINYE